MHTDYLNKLSRHFRCAEGFRQRHVMNTRPENLNTLQMSMIDIFDDSTVTVRLTAYIMQPCSQFLLAPYKRASQCMNSRPPPRKHPSEAWEIFRHKKAPVIRKASGVSASPRQLMAPAMRKYRLKASLIAALKEWKTQGAPDDGLSVGEDGSKDDSEDESEESDSGPSAHGEDLLVEAFPGSLTAGDSLTHGGSLNLIPPPKESEQDVAVAEGRGCGTCHPRKGATKSTFSSRWRLIWLSR